MSKVQEAHLRLMAALPVRTHSSDPLLNIFVASRGARKIVIDGQTYPSIGAACRSLRVSTTTLYGYLKSGKAMEAPAGGDSEELA